QADIEPLAQAVAEAELGSARQTLALHQAEALRLSLVADDQALTEFMAQHPGCDAQQLRSLIRPRARKRPCRRSSAMGVPGANCFNSSSPTYRPESL
ncbi:MAG: DUF615 domain-containing protein, partial [Betaproteobacteria bacterium]